MDGTQKDDWLFYPVKHMLDRWIFSVYLWKTVKDDGGSRRPQGEEEVKFRNPIIVSYLHSNLYYYTVDTCCSSNCLFLPFHLSFDKTNEHSATKGKTCPLHHVQYCALLKPPDAIWGFATVCESVCQAGCEGVLQCRLHQKAAFMMKNKTHRFTCLS